MTRHALIFTILFCGVSKIWANGDPAQGVNRDVESLNWDLSTDRRLEVVDWPKDRVSDYWSIQKTVRISVKVSDEIRFTSMAEHILVYQKNSHVTAIEIHEVIQTREDAYERGSYLIREWKLPVKDLNEWFEKARTLDTSMSFVTGSGTNRPSASVEIRHSFNNEKPWYVLIRWFFEPVE